MSQMPDQLGILTYRVNQVEHEVKQKVAARELGLQLAPIHREMAAIRDQMNKFQTDQAQRDKQQQEKEAKIYKWLLGALWGLVIGVVGFGGSILLILIQRWIG
jgi:hypothetical protein